MTRVPEREQRSCEDFSGEKTRYARGIPAQVANLLSATNKEQAVNQSRSQFRTYSVCSAKQDRRKFSHPPTPRQDTRDTDTQHIPQNNLHNLKNSHITHSPDMKNRDRRIERLTQDLQRLQFEQSEIIRELNRLSHNRPINTSPTERGPITVGCWVRITNNYNNEKGLAGRVSRITPKTVVFLTRHGEKRRSKDNVERIAVPRGVRPE